MAKLNTIVPLLSSIVGFVSAGFVLARFARRRQLYLLLWGLGLIMYAIGGLCEALFGALGWSAIVFRLWYLFGAVLVAAWLGQGTVYLLIKKRVAHVLMLILLLASIYGAVRVFTAELDPNLMTESVQTGSELSGHAIVTPGVRVLTPFFNVYGTLTLVGGALWSAIVFFRKRILLHRTLGSVLIAVGAILPAFGGSFSRMGIPNALYFGEFLGVVLIFLGYLRAVNPIEPQTPRAGETEGDGQG